MELVQKSVWKNGGQRLRRWEAALMAGLAIALLTGVWLDREQAALAEQVVRLHVIANSDSDADQALKLQVRDRVLEAAAEACAGAQTAEEAVDLLRQALPALETAAKEAVTAAGADCAVSASLEDDVWFPTKTYDGFALPQGQYTALRVVLGEGAGRNWWCVVFPPLCQSSATEAQPVLAALGEEEAALLTGESEGYVIKFKAMELWEGFCHWAEGD
ncbi:stage II sporulation protein R [Intestinimonas timonensis]|uniref:stage II sporulation protein R n=1 Tax=Intestinimonas timonensis TaxID=1689270 RepID=UPI003A93FE25